MEIVMGRPKTEGDRYPSGDLKPRVDRGTPELVARRLALTEGHENPALASYPLGVLLARGVINQDQHNAGVQYATAFWKAFGKPFAKAVNLTGLSGHGEPDGDVGRLHAAQGSFPSRHCRDVVENVSVYERALNPKHAALLKEGLSGLVHFFGQVKKAA